MGGDNVGKGSFGCVACTSLMALIFYAVGLSMPIWAGYWINDRKCEQDKGCTQLLTAKGKDIPEVGCTYKTHGLYIADASGPTKAGMDAWKKLYKDEKLAKAHKEGCVKKLKGYTALKGKDVQECSYNDETFSCACPFLSKDNFDLVIASVEKAEKGNKDHCKDMKKKYDDIKGDYQTSELMKGAWGNCKLAAIVLIVACVCHFLAMVMGYIGLATGHFALGIGAACFNILAVAMGITGLITGSAGVYLLMTGQYCGSWEWYKAANTQIPQPDDQVHAMGMGAIMVIIGIVFSVISACSSCGSVAAAKRAAAGDGADGNYNKF